MLSATGNGYVLAGVRKTDPFDPDSDDDGCNDLIENQSGSDPLDANSVLNSSPSDLNYVVPLTIAENQPIGTVVGEFNATDPDAGAALTTVWSAEETETTALTRIERNAEDRGDLDYESNASTYSIREAKDEYNATVEGNFTVQLLNNPSDDLDFQVGHKVFGFEQFGLE